MANEKTIIIDFGVPESVHAELSALAASQSIRLDQLCTIAIGAGLVQMLKKGGKSWIRSGRS